MKHTRKGNFFSLPNEMFLLGLSPGELAVYSYLQRCENRKTHQRISTTVIVEKIGNNCRR